MTGPARDAAGTLRVRRRVAGTPDAAFTAWTDPARLARWMTPVGTAVADVDLRVGGRFSVVMRGDGREIEHTGEYLEVEPPRRLRFTWASPYTGPQPSVVTVTLTAAPDGTGTDVELVHEQLPAGAETSHASGWGAMLDRLSTLLLQGVEA